MTTYIFKRILLMFPTLFAIAIIIFIVLNFAPGQPGGAAQSADGAQDSQSAEGRESYRIFKEQFNLDKPVMFNTRFALSKAEVEAELIALADFQRPVCGPDKAEQNCIDEAVRPRAARIIKAQDVVEDWGQYVVPQLIDIANTHDRVDVRIQAINRLATNAKRRLINEYGRKQSDSDREFNREVSAENNTIGKWTLPSSSTKEEVEAHVNATWNVWFAEKKERWEWGFADKAKIFIVDTRFAKYWGNLMRFDFGVSHVDKRPVLTKIMERLPYTLVLNLLSIIIAYLLSIPLGVWSAYRQNSRADRIMTAVLFALYSLPSFFIGVLLLQTFADGDPLGWFPTGGFAGRLPEWYGPRPGIESTADMTVWEYTVSVSYHMVLPAFCLTYGSIASLSRYARTGILDTIRADFIRTARAKGLSESMVIIKHAVRNGMIPVLTLLGTMLPALIGGSVVIEYVFNIPGMGLFMFESIFARDYNAIMGVLLISTVLTLVGLLLSDISYALVDPRISFD
jgi:peptide/nickel transport system permease protein